jgi:maleate cis-trans isomerase
MPTIKCNTEELKVARCDAYSTLFNDTLDEYEANMREHFDYEEPLEFYIEGCRDFEVNTIEKTEYEALEAIGTNCNALAVSRMIMGMNKAVIDFYEENGYDIDVSKLTEIGKLYTMWRYVVTNAVEWEEIEDD